jgi:uncharacterized repeat protein (TIGR03803 family)
VSKRQWAQTSGISTRVSIAALAFAVALTMTVIPNCAQAQTYTVLYAFPGDASQGRDPDLHSRLIRDKDGNLYGTTFQGGPGACDPNGLCGTVFKLSTDGTATVLHTFNNLSSGSSPIGDLLRDAKENLYGKTEVGGHGTCPSLGSLGCGVVFKLSSQGQLTVLHDFTGGLDGGTPQGLVRDPAGNLYGTTQTGGGTNCSNNGLTGCGVVFKISAKGEFTVLYRFMGGADGAGPALSSLIRDNSGNLYGATTWGGSPCDVLQAGCGTIFRIDPAGNESVLFRFAHSAEGVSPQGFLVRDKTGNIYGIARSGGLQSNPILACDGGCGLIFKIDSAGNEVVLYRFTGNQDGASPASGVIRDNAGDLYGSTIGGGTGFNDFGDPCGVIFELDAAGNESVLHSFPGSPDGCFPNGVVRDRAGNLYGTTFDGGMIGPSPNCNLDGCGLIFKIAP